MAILGYAPGEMIGRSAAGFIYPGDVEMTRGEMRLARSDGTPATLKRDMFTRTVEW